MASAADRVVIMGTLLIMAVQPHGVMADPAISYSLFLLPESGNGLRVVDDLKKKGKSNIKHVV